MSDAYARAGVDVSAGNRAVEQYKQVTASWRHPKQLDSLGGFGGLFELPGDAKRALVASTDGVGTKVLIAAHMQSYDSVGADLVNHCVNDILVVSATPLFFLDYLAVGKLNPEIAAKIVSGVHTACRLNNVALLGGETAEMPDVYRAEHFDLAGTMVGIVDLDALPASGSVSEGDVILGLPSNGLHTNGYTLARALIPSHEWNAPFDAGTFGDALLAPHPSYYQEVRAIQAVSRVNAMAHITGGGLLENVPRTLPESSKAVFEQSRWTVPPLLSELCRRGQLEHRERYRTFNMGIGYTLIVPQNTAKAALAAAPRAMTIGWIEKRHEGEEAVVIYPAR